MTTGKGRKIGWSVMAMSGLLVAWPAFPQAAPTPALPPLPIAAPKTVQRKPGAPVRPPLVTAVAPPTAPAVSSPVVSSPPVAVPPPTVPTAAIAPAAPVHNPFAPADPNIIKWDADTKESTSKPGEADAKYTFWLTNVSSSVVLINSVRTSCGCTVAKLPAQPWHIPPGSNGPIEVTLSLAGKSGLISKGVTVDTSAGIKQLTIRCTIPSSGPVAPGSVPVMQSGTMGDAERLKNMQLAMADRQVVFKNQDCAKCHAEPARNKTDGRLLYAGVCATCHNSHHRAAMVPDLRTLQHPTDADYWRQWIMHGKPGSMMPAFAESEGGPLNEQQVNALVDFMLKAFPSRKPSFE
jgi:mono/diheme cytochrome c family protein